MSNYPALKENIEKNVISFIYNNGPKYKQNILSLIEMELAYMNTRHEEFRMKTYAYITLYFQVSYN